MRDDKKAPFEILQQEIVELGTLRNSGALVLQMLTENVGLKNY
jgi:hypothetical protein